MTAATKLTATKLTADDLDWEEPRIARSSGGGLVEALCVQVAEMRAALSARRGSWAVLETYPKAAKASSVSNALTKRRKNGDSRLTGIEFAGRKDLETAGSKLYVRQAPA